MGNNYLHHATSPATQQEVLPGQVKNSAGGASFAVDDWVRLERFLILGSEGGSYYATERALTRENAKVVEHLVKTDGPRLVEAVATLSESGRAPKNDPAILALAMAARLGDAATRAAAFAALPRVCRTGTHLYHFVDFADKLGGWGSGFRRALARWFNAKSVSDLALQLVKYQQRDGWSASDVLRLAHPQPATADHSALYRWARSGYDACAQDGMVLPPIVEAFEEAKTTDDAKRLCALVTQYRLPRECVPTKWLKDPKVWEALLPHMGLTALVRNLGNMTKCGLVAPLSGGLSTVLDKLGDAEALRKSRVHPIQLLAAQATYGAGRGQRGSSTWVPVQQVVDALDAAFYASFKNVTSTGRPTLLALDVSGSMDCGQCSGLAGITPRVGAAAMALVTAAVEPNYHLVGFTAGRRGYGGMHGGDPCGLTDVAISPKMRLAEACQVMRQMRMGGTDCALPFLWAKGQLARGARVENFAVYTDNETWAGSVHPHVALADYRRASGLPARSAVVSMVANAFSIADPNDPGMMDFVGFDAAAPAVMADFFRGGAPGAGAAEDDGGEAEVEP